MRVQICICSDGNDMYQSVGFFLYQSETILMQSVFSLYQSDTILMQSVFSLHQSDTILMQSVFSLHQSDTILMQSVFSLHQSDTILIQFVFSLYQRESECFSTSLKQCGISYWYVSFCIRLILYQAHSVSGSFCIYSTHI